MPSGDPAPFLSFACATVSMGASLLAQSTLLITAGLLVAWSTRHRSAASRSLVLRVTLASVVLAPVASLAMTGLGVPGIMIDLPRDNAARARGSAPTSSPVARTGQLSQTTPVSPSPGGSPRAMPAPGDSSGHEGPSVLADREPSTASPDWTPRLYAALSGLWALGTCLLLLRLVTAMARVARFRRTAPEAGATLRAQCAEVAGELGLRAPRLLINPEVRSPCLIGLRRPAILLPQGFGAQQTVPTDVLVHELAHLARGDCAWNLLAGLVQAALFFQPLVWLLTRRIEDASDDAADDCVVEFGLDRWGYAQHLTDIAQRYEPARSEAIAGMGVVTLRSSLGRRIQRILDTTREVSTHPGMRTVVMAAVLGLCATVAAGLLGASGTQKAPPSEWRVTLSNGTTVELVGLSTHPSSHDSWWTPDGAPLPEAPYAVGSGRAYAQEDEQAVEVAFRVDPPVSSRALVRVRTRPSGTRASSTPKDARGSPLRGLDAFAATFPEHLKACGVSIGVAGGPWSTVAEVEFAKSGIWGEVSNAWASRDVAFTGPYEKDGQTCMIVAHDIVDRDDQLVAVDAEGHEHSPCERESSRRSAFVQLTARFELPLARIAAVRLKTRPFQWATFENVRLSPELKRSAEPPPEAADAQSEGSGPDPVRPQLQFRWVAKEGDPGPFEELPLRKPNADGVEMIGVLTEPLMHGASIVSVAAAREGHFDSYEVHFEWERKAAERFAEITERNIGRRLAIVFKGEVICAPVVRSRITTHVSITGNLSEGDAQAIVDAIERERKARPSTLSGEVLCPDGEPAVGAPNDRVGLRHAGRAPLAAPAPPSAVPCLSVLLLA